MEILAGTARGVFKVGHEAARQVLASRGVRDLHASGGRVFAGTGAGVYASDDGGETWVLVGLSHLEVWQIRSSGDGVLYAGTQPAALYRSDDGGSSWDEVESFRRAPEAAEWCVPVEPRLPGRARAIVVDREDRQRLWVGVEVGGIMRSEDAGATWELVLPGGNPDLHVMAAHPTRPEVLFASTGYGRLDGVAEMIEGNAGVFRSEDSGNTWEYAWRGVTPRYSRPMCIDLREPYALTVASAPDAFASHKREGGAGAMLFQSLDGGEFWRSLCDQAHSPSRENIHGLMPDPELPSAVLIGTDTGEVWRVSGAGEWTLTASGMPAVLALVGCR